MKIKIDLKEHINDQKKTQKKCVELLGKDKFMVVDLEKMVETLKSINEFLTKICTTTTTIKTKSCGGSVANLEVPTVTQSKLYQDNECLILSLTKEIDIAKTNNLECVTDFNFTDEQILNYAQQKNIIK